MEWDSPLTLFGIIATVLALVFALAAFITTQRRRHMAAKSSTAPVDEHEAPPLPMLHQTIQQQVDNKPAPPARHQPIPAATNGAIFKQSGGSGVNGRATAMTDGDAYVWE